MKTIKLILITVLASCYLVQGQNKIQDSLISTIYEQPTYKKKFWALQKSKVDSLVLVKLYSKFLTDLDKENNLANQTYINGCLAVITTRQKKTQAAITYARKAYVVGHDVNDSEFICHLLRLLEGAYNDVGNNLQVVAIIHEMSKVCEKENPLLFHMYNILGQFDLAIENYRSFYGVDDPTKFTKFEYAIHLNNIGVYHLRQDKVDSALHYYKLSYKNILEHKKEGIFKNKPRFKFWEGNVQGNIGNCYMRKGDYARAIPLLLIDRERSREFFASKGKPDIDLRHFIEMGTCYLNLGEHEKAKLYVDSVNTFPSNSKISEFKSVYFNAVRNIDSTTYYFQKTITENRSAKEQLNKDNYATAQQFFQLEKVLNQRRESIVTAEAENKKKTFLLWVFVFMSFVFSLIALWMYSLFTKKKQQQHLINVQKNIIEESLDEKRVLLREVHHRVKNNMQMISSMLRLELKKIDNEHSREVFKHTINRVIVLSKIHNNLYDTENLNKVPIEDYIKNISDYLVQALCPDGNVSFNFNIDSNIQIHMDKTIVLGLIINELFTNSCKYAFYGSENNFVNITLIKNGASIRFNYVDSGSGFDWAPTDSKESKSIGMKLIFKLIRQLGGTYTLLTKNGMNLSFIFIEKLTAKDIYQTNNTNTTNTKLNQPVLN